MTFENAHGEEEYFVGSGYMVSPTEMMTCAHCLFARPEEGGYGIVTRLVVEPAVNGDFYPFARYDSDEEVSRYSMPALYQDPSTSEEDSFIYDFALVQFPSPLTDGSFIRLNSPSGTGPVHVSGYPAEVRGVSNETNQYEDWGTYSYMDGPFLEHDTSASGGQSGSPMLNRRDEAVGVYGYSYEDRITGEQSGIGGGVAMTLSVLDYADHALENEDGTGITSLKRRFTAYTIQTPANTSIRRAPTKPRSFPASAGRMKGLPGEMRKAKISPKYTVSTTRMSATIITRSIRMKPGSSFLSAGETKA
ncbi:trypsin-like peptidase domain-containing protein [Allobaculum sp. Allo2]|nr:trypsin-like peptidase domain-containing protein [Allobaculum sp. Allo2]UNT92727.1 trypsin-like peptidase domain-containing protein [Allobaculum sp. Allo2]